MGSLNISQYKTQPIIPLDFLSDRSGLSQDRICFFKVLTTLSDSVNLSSQHLNTSIFNLLLLVAWDSVEINSTESGSAKTEQ